MRRLLLNEIGREDKTADDTWASKRNSNILHSMRHSNGLQNMPSTHMREHSTHLQKDTLYLPKEMLETRGRQDTRCSSKLRILNWLWGMPGKSSKRKTCNERRWKHATGNADEKHATGNAEHNHATKNMQRKTCNGEDGNIQRKKMETSNEKHATGNAAEEIIQKKIIDYGEAAKRSEDPRTKRKTKMHEKGHSLCKQSQPIGHVRSHDDTSVCYRTCAAITTQKSPDKTTTNDVQTIYFKKSNV